MLYRAATQWVGVLTNCAGIVDATQNNASLSEQPAMPRSISASLTEGFWKPLYLLPSRPNHSNFPRCLDGQHFKIWAPISLYWGLEGKARRREGLKAGKIFAVQRLKARCRLHWAALQPLAAALGLGTIGWDSRFPGLEALVAQDQVMEVRVNR